MRRILLLGGIGEAVWLARQLQSRHQIIYSLAGRGRSPDLNCNVRSGGFGGVDGLTAAAQVEAGSYWSGLGGHTGWFGLGFMLGTLSIGFGPLGQPHLLNRLMAMKSSRDIRLARGVALSWFVLVLCGMYLLGVCAHVLLKGATAESEQVFFVMAEQLLPAVFTGVDWDPESGWVAIFVSRYGDSYGLDQRGIELRIRYLRTQGMDCGEEKKALRALPGGGRGPAVHHGPKGPCY